MKKAMFVGLVVVGLLLNIIVVNAAEEGVAVKVGEGNLTISGYTHFRYGYTEFDDPDTLSIVRARLILAGTVVPDVSYRFQYDIRPLTGGLRDAFVKVVCPISGIPVTMGQFKIPISEAGLVWGTPLQSLITGPIIYEGYTYKKAGYTTVTISDREIGVMLDGKVLDNSLGYALGVVNGNGINAADDNNNKDVFGRITLSPIKELNLGVGAMTGGEASNTYKVRTRYIATAKYDLGSLKLIGEYLYQTREKSSGKLDTHNWYATISNTFKCDEKTIEPVVRYQQYYGPVTVLNQERVDVATAGLNFGLNKYTKLQVNYNYIQDEVGAIDNEVLAQVELKF
jgi:hypothetical protein